MDVDTRITSIEKEKSHGESEEYEDEPEEDHDSEQHGYQDEEGGPICCIGKSSEGGWHTKGKSEGKGQVDGACSYYGKTGHRSRDCWSEWAKAKARANRNGKEEKPTASTDTVAATTTNHNSSYNHNNGSYNGGGKFVNVCDSQPFASQPQPTYPNHGEGHRLRISSRCWLNGQWMKNHSLSNTAHSRTRSVMRSTLQPRGVTLKDRIQSRRARTREAPKEQMMNENRRTRVTIQPGGDPRTLDT